MRPFCLKSCLIASLAVLAMCLFCSPTGAQTDASSTSIVSTISADASDATGPSLPLFKAQSTLIEVPVVVTDKSGNSIHGLKRNDFTVLENGKEQKISFMEEVKAATGKMAMASAPGTFSNIYLQADQPHCVTAIVLDTINTPFSDQAYARSQLIKYLSKNISPGQAIMLLLISNKGLVTLSDLTTDSAAVVQALRKVNGEVSAMETFSGETQAMAANAGHTGIGIGSGMAGPMDLASPAAQLAPNGGAAISNMADTLSRLRNFLLSGDTVEAGYWQARATEVTFRSFLSIALSLSGIPGRKSVVWLTGGFPFLLDSPTARPSDSALSRLYVRTLEALNEAQISVYPVDARGIVDLPIADGSQRAMLFGPRLMGEATSLQELELSKTAMFNTFADMTGGKAFYNNNDLTSGIRHAVEDSSSYYLLGYYFDRRNKANWQKLQIKVQRPDVKVRARSGFLVAETAKERDLTQRPDINFAMDSPLDSTGVAFQVHLRAVGVDPNGMKKTAFEIVVPEAEVVDETNKNRFDVQFAWQTGTGGKFNRFQQGVKGALDAATLAKVRAEGVRYGNTLELQPDSYQLKFVVRDNLSGKIGSVSAPLALAK